MKRITIIMLACVLLAFTACESRPGGASSSAGSAPDDAPAAQPAAPIAPAAEIPAPVSGPSSAPSGPARATVTDVGLVNLARNIVGELMERTIVADEIYRAALRHDDVMTPMVMGGRAYQPVIDERFHTLEDIRAFLDSTFINGGEATRRFAELQNSDVVYDSINGELYMNIEPRMTPLTMGAWDIATLELLLMEDREIEVSMQTTMLGRPEGVKILRVIRDGDNWLLGDSFFLD